MFRATFEKRKREELEGGREAVGEWGLNIGYWWKIGRLRVAIFNVRGGRDCQGALEWKWQNSWERESAKLHTLSTPSNKEVKYSSTHAYAKNEKKTFSLLFKHHIIFFNIARKKHSFSLDQCIVTFTSVSHGFRAVSNELSFFYKHILCGLVETNEYAGADEKWN